MRPGASCTRSSLPKRRTEVKLEYVPLDQIVWNPWRDKELYPIDDDHVKGLRESINDHGFFVSIKGRRVNGKVEIGCGHARIAAARKAKLDTVPIFVAALDDDAMLRLMADENALQSGSHPGAIINEVAAVTRRLIDGLLSPDNCPEKISRLFNGDKGIKQTRTKLRTGSDVHRTLGVDVIRAYLGQGNPERSQRGEREIRDAISTLKESGHYDEIVDRALRKYPQPVGDGKPAKGTTVATSAADKPRRAPTFDARCVTLFPNTHQAQAFREAVTTSGARQVIPVDKQYPLAKRIMRDRREDGRKNWSRKQVGAPQIKVAVQAEVETAMKKQREIDKEESERYLAEQR